MSVGQLVCGAHAVVYVNSLPYGRVSRFDWRIDQSATARHGIDLLTPTDLVRAPVGVSFSLAVYRRHRDGGAEGAGMVATWQDLAREKLCAILVADRLNDATLFRADECRVTGQGWNVGTGFATGQVSFIGLTYANEVQPGTL